MGVEDVHQVTDQTSDSVSEEEILANACWLYKIYQKSAFMGWECYC